MEPQGLKAVRTPRLYSFSEPRLSRQEQLSSSVRTDRGRCWSVQALVDQVQQTPTASAGYETHRLNMLLAILHAMRGSSLDQDVFVNVAGACVLSNGLILPWQRQLFRFSNKPIDRRTVFFGELYFQAKSGPCPRRRAVAESTKLGFVTGDSCREQAGIP